MKGIVSTFLVLVFCATNHAAETRPNFLFIVADDQSPEALKIYRPDSRLDTPTIDQLAAEGVVLEQAYQMGSFSGAVCTPSRHMIMTGRTLWRLPIGPGRKSAPPDLVQQTLPAVFNRAGYDTMRSCKAGNTYRDANRQFDVVHDADRRGASDEAGSPWHADRVLDFLAEREAAGDDDPFFIYLGFSHPHDPRNGTPELLAKYGATNHESDQQTPPELNPEAPPLPENYLPEHPFHHGHRNLRDEVAVSGVWRNRDEATVRNELGREYACSEQIDRQIARVLQQLRDSGEYDNTYVIYTSDHGIAVGRHGLMGKQNLYEHTWRVPYVVRGPGIPAGERAAGNIYLLDTLPTLCDLAGIVIPETVDGKSFKPVLRGEQSLVRDTLYGVYSGGSKPGIRAIRQGDWKLIKYDVLDGKVQETQLFNLADNPNELLAEHGQPDLVEATGHRPERHQRNLADDPSYADVRARLESRLVAEQQRLGDPHHLATLPP